MFYGQRKEDQKLRSLIGEKDPGFYVDVGAWEPDIDSITKHFYDRGWSGINIEPVPYYFDKLIAARPRDVTIMCGVGASPAFKDFFYVENSGLSTFNAEYAKKAHEEQNRQIIAIPTPIRTLKYILDQYSPGQGGIDFLKVDCEGWERDVLLGNDWKLYRPRFICVEATVPMTEIPSWDDWEPILMENGYHFVDFDGLNRFYRAQEI